MTEEKLIESLKPHPANERIYGDTYDHELISSIEKYGLRGTIEITKDDVIISGHRRWFVCRELGYETIPVTILEETDEQKLIEYLIKMNQATRKRTNEQIAREFEVLLEIEEKESKKRQISNLKQGNKIPVVENFPQQEGKARDKAASKLNNKWSGRTAETAIDIVNYADGIEADEPEAAKGIKEILNNKSVNAAKKTVQEHKIKSDKKLNATNDNIEWAKWSWNPVTGCLHDCQYCYARDIATRFDGHFKPAFHEDRLSAPANTTIPAHRINEIGINNIFVCSMADLFGAWVNPEWIEKVINICKEQNHWTYLFLTKNPKRYLDFDFPENCWLGASATNQTQFDEAINAFKEMETGCIKFLSCEPLNEEICVKLPGNYEKHPHTELENVDWLIIGGRSKNSRMKAFQPEWFWVEHLFESARVASVPVYFKPNLTVRPREYPE
ncbi:DUF5131 family protein [Desulfobacula sp.]|uniref:DUF5131 family protein n=1 Tax=Desulfobacula sp. TaxID=2593537 RepID=UPI001ECAE0F8|nr:DUF5131 family protein [Desulfobacula sp.]